MRAINAGNLRHRITFQQATQSSDQVNALGERIAGWSDFWSAWASIEPIQGKELATLRSQGATETHRIRVRYYPGINPTMQIRFGPEDAFSNGFSNGFAGGLNAIAARYFRIGSILNTEERNYELVILAEENLHP